MSPNDKPLVWLTGTLESPPVGRGARIECGYLLRLLQRGERLSMPASRPMPSIGARCHELRVDDVEGSRTWRVVYRIDPDAIVIADWFFKKTEQTASSRIERCRQRLRQYDRMGG